MCLHIRGYHAVLVFMLLMVALIFGVSSRFFGGDAALTAHIALSAPTITVTIYATHVHIRDRFGSPSTCCSFPSNSCALVASVSNTKATAYCQQVGETIHYAGYSNRLWLFVG